MLGGKYYGEKEIQRQLKCPGVTVGDEGRPVLSETECVH